MSSFKPVKTVLVGCGMIGLSGYQPRILAYKNKIDLIGYFDQHSEGAKKAQAVAGGKIYAKLEDVLNDASVEAIVNTTTADGHHPVSLAALRAGKHVYSEKPLASSVRQATDLIQTAAEMKVQIACAPSATLGYEQQSVWKRIREGEIGTPISCVGNFSGKVDSWHPNADIFLNCAPGVIADAAPYPLTMMTLVLGPVKRLYGWSPISVPDRTIQAGARTGTNFKVSVPDHAVVLLEFECGARGLLMTSWTTYSEVPRFEIQGPKGMIAVNPHDDGRGIRRHTIEPNSDYINEPPPAKAYTGLDWGKGVADLADAIRNNRPARCQATQARHVVEIAEATSEATRTGQPVELKTRFDPPAPVGDIPPWE